MRLFLDHYGLPTLEYDDGTLLRLEMEEITGIWKEKAEKELRETPENVKKGLVELRDMILADEELFIPIEREYLIKFLRPCKYYADSAYKRLSEFYRFKEQYPAYFHNLTPKDLRPAIEAGIVNGLPYRDQHGRRIILFNLYNFWNQTKISAVDCFRVLQLTVEGGLIEPMTQVNGVVAIMDWTDFSIRHISKINFTDVRVFLDFVQHKIPIRLKAIHLVNTPRAVHMVLKAVKPFMASKLSKRIHLHGYNVKALLDHIDSQYLPEKYGGTSTLPDFDFKWVAEAGLLFQEEFEAACQFGYNKPNKVPVYEGMFYNITPNIKRFKELTAKEQQFDIEAV